MITPVLSEALRWWYAGESVALATVTATTGSAPRPPGSVMLVAPDGTATGSVSAGCVEAAVYQLCRRVLDTGEANLSRFGDTDEVFGPGLTCGGEVEVYVERVDRAAVAEFDQLCAQVRGGSPVAAVTCVTGPAVSRGRWLLVDDGAGVRGTLGDAGIDAVAARAGRELLAAGRTGLVRPVPGVSLLVRSFVPPPRMIIFGASDFTAALARQGRFLGYRVTVCDARSVFTTAQRFPDAAEVVVDWPHRYLGTEVDAGRVDHRTVLCVLTHDPKFDVPLLRLALDLPVAYLGAMGSRRSTDDRVAQLRAVGVPATALARLSAPIGLDIGARTPEETAVSVAAEIIAAGAGRPGGRLTIGTGSIHPTSHTAAATLGRSAGGEPQREEEVHPVLEPAQVPAGQLLDPVDPVPQGVDVHM
ncbi:XdhC family protein [Micromonospora sp. NBC_01813]|uniref:XdhC family protein n=1 Tax=Micromonospora sp. NBC_01813 TaxID=2975988 RepID=UPI002DD7E361|nr:XdhC family protein [Micromonospora sp. NBC_01813]WSA10314.1 XdhC family protein [Micromonospora sp. NBC_01813]